MSRSLTVKMLKKYPAKYFIETGSYTGGGIHIALLSGYKKIISIENNPMFYNACVRTYKNNPSVELFLGDSKDILKGILNEIDEQAVIFLDAHSPGNQPILDELDSIKNCHIKNHIIMIDDKREFKRGVWEPSITLEILLEKLLEINPEYKITYEDSINAKKDIIVAFM